MDEAIRLRKRCGRTILCRQDGFVDAVGPCCTDGKTVAAVSTSRCLHAGIGCRIAQGHEYIGDPGFSRIELTIVVQIIENSACNRCGHVIIS